MRKKIYRLISGFLTAVLLAGTVGAVPAKAAVDFGWEEENGNWYWYENGVRQGYDPDNAAYRGKEIYDPGSDAWYWLDNVDQGKKAVSKDVYQESTAGNWAGESDGTGKWVRYDGNGHMIKGWDTNENGTYYFDPVYGTMAKGYAVIGGSLHYFDKATGVESPAGWEGINGWVVVENIDGNCYWYENGVRQGYDPENPAYRGKEIYDPESDAWYWLDNVDQGKKAVSKDVYQESAAGEWAAGADGTGKWVRYDAQGHMIKGWSTNENGTYYFDPIYGTMAKGVVTIDGKRYEFDRTTGVLLRALTDGDYEYTEAVVDGLTGSTDYRVEAEQGTEGRVVLPANEITASLKQGDILVLPETAEWQDGLILKISGAETRNGEVRVTGEVPDDPLEVYESVSIQGTAQAELGEVSVEDGVTFRVVETGQKSVGGTDSDSMEPCSLELKGATVGIMKTMEYKIEELGTTVSIEIPEISYDINYDKNGVKALYVELPNEIAIKTEVSREFSGEKKLGSIPFMLPAGFSVEVELVLLCSVEGTASIELRLDNTVGVNYENGSLRYIAECTPSQTITLSADAKAGVKMEVGVYFAKNISEAWDKFTDWWKGEDDKKNGIQPIYNVGSELGIGFDAKQQTHAEVNLTCVDVGMWLYMNLYAGDGSFIGDTFNLTKTWSVYDQNNSPLKKSVHLEKKNQENLKRVETCTYKALVSLSDCTVTLSQSRYLYDGTAKTPTVTVKSGSTTIAASEYTVGYSNNVNAGTATVTITAKSGSTKVTGSTTKTFTISQGAGETGETGETEETDKKTALSECTVVLSQKNYLYNGTAKKPTVTVKNGSTIVAAEEYTVEYSDNVKIGTATVTITAGSGSTEISGSISVTFTIEGEPMYQGKSGGIEWWISTEGKLTVIGSCGSDGILPRPWEEAGYNVFVKSAYMNVDGAKDLSGLFMNDFAGLESVDLSQLDTSEVTDMSSMFRFQYSNKLKSVDLSGFDTSKVTDMSYMFVNCSNLESLDVSSFDTGNVTDMTYMFGGCQHLTSLDVSSFDTGKVTDMSGMFSLCRNLTSLDLSSFDTGKVTDMFNMFQNSYNLQKIKVGPGWTTGQADTGGMFIGCPAVYVY